jgi:hypothetical protein
MPLDVLRERITHTGLTGSLQLHFHDLGCQPIAALRFALEDQGELTSIEQ